MRKWLEARGITSEMQRAGAVAWGRYLQRNPVEQDGLEVARLVWSAMEGARRREGRGKRMRRKFAGWLEP